MGQKILVAIDESENSMRAVEYIANNYSHDHKITLYSVVMDTPAICEMNNPSLTPYFLSQKDAFCSIEDQKKLLINEALEKGKNRLMEAGFKEEHISVKVESVKKGVARGIIEEADTGYDSIVLGRRGLAGLKEFFLGSVSQKVLQSAKGVSVLLVD